MAYYNFYHVELCCGFLCCLDIWLPNDWSKCEIAQTVISALQRGFFHFESWEKKVSAICRGTSEFLNLNINISTLWTSIPGSANSKGHVVSTHLDVACANITPLNPPLIRVVHKFQPFCMCTKRTLSNPLPKACCIKLLTHHGCMYSRTNTHIFFGCLLH